MGEVFFANARARASRSLIHKLRDLLERCGAKEIFRRGERVALKVHFGEMGNTSYLEPSFARVVVDKLKEWGVEPFITDTNTLYRGKRAKTEDHIATARAHGFSEESMGAPVIIADEFVSIPAAGVGPGEAMIARLVWEADGVIFLTHATGHVLYGFAGALKNLAMGCASPSVKQLLHSDLKPEVDEEKCVACGTCVGYCPVNAITLEEGSKARIDREGCIGCGECVAVCPVEAIPILWKSESRRVAEKTAAFARAVLSNKEGKALFLNFLVGITPDCDCCDWSDVPIVPDLGILASRDVVAVDQASVDLIAKAPIVGGSIFEEKLDKHPVWRNLAAAFAPYLHVRPRVREKFRLLYGVDVGLFLREAERHGLGSRRYTLHTIPEPAQ